MKRFVTEEMKVGAVVAIIVLAIAAVIRADEVTIFFLAFVGIVGYGLYDERSLWLRRSPLGRWFRR